MANPAALVIPVSGPYTGTWNALSIGTNSDDGYELQCTIQGQEINETDAYGMTLVEGIYRGQNWRVRYRALEWKTGGLNALQQFGLVAGGGPLNPFLANTGDKFSKFSAALVLTAILGNPPTTPQTLTALLASIAPQNQSAFNLTSKMRELPIELVLLPYAATISSTSYNVPFTVT